MQRAREGHTSKSTAAILGLNPGTVRNWVCNLRRRGHLPPLYEARNNSDENSLHYIENKGIRRGTIYELLAILGPHNVRKIVAEIPSGFSFQEYIGVLVTDQLLDKEEKDD